MKGGGERSERSRGEKRKRRNSECREEERMEKGKEIVKRRINSEKRG